jgi:hypothetical protein
MQANPLPDGTYDQAPMTARLLLVLIILAWVPLAACGFYSADEITAYVVDAETRTPLEGVNVVAAWEVKGGLEGGNVLGYVNVMEAVTNKDGSFHFSSWGPRPNMHFGVILIEAPQLLFFKSGYRFHTVVNGGSVWTRAPSAMKSDWNGKTIALQAFKGTPSEYKRGFNMLQIYVDGLGTWGDHWSEMPKFLCALAYQDEVLAAQGVPNALYPVSLLRDRGVNCKRPDNASKDRK